MQNYGDLPGTKDKVQDRWSIELSITELENSSVFHEYLVLNEMTIILHTVH